MAKSGMGLLLVGGAVVVGLVLMSGGKAKASEKGKKKDAEPVDTEFPKDKPTKSVDADDGKPMKLPDLSDIITAPLPDVKLPLPDPFADDHYTPPSLNIAPVPPLSPPEEPPTAEELMRPVKGEGGRWTVTREDGSDVAPNAAIAKAKAQAMADHVRTKKAKYDRPRLAVWQALAGIEVDGLYGPATQAALQSMGARNVPKPLFRGGQ
jgi:hypothetical protein